MSDKQTPTLNPETEREFDKEFWFDSDLGRMTTHEKNDDRFRHRSVKETDLKQFIAKVEADAYERGRSECPCLSKYKSLSTEDKE